MKSYQPSRENNNMSKKKKRNPIRPDRKIELLVFRLQNHNSGAHVDKKRKQKMKRQKITSEEE